MTKKVIGILLVIALLIFLVSGSANDAIAELTAWLRGQGHVGAAIFVVAYAIAATLLVPAAPLTLMAGAVYGLLWGYLYVSVASVLGAAVPFLITRKYARDAVIKRFGHDPRVTAIDNAVDREGWRIVFLTRLSPLLPYNILNYALGLSKISFSQYLLWSWLGMIPGTVLYVYLGAAAGRLAGTHPQEAASTLETVAFWLGIVATAALTFYVSRLTKRALDSAVEQNSPSQ